MKQLIPDLTTPKKTVDPDASQYDFVLDGKIRIEVKASRAVDAGSSEPLIIKALGSDSPKRFDMNFQQLRWTDYPSKVQRFSTQYPVRPLTSPFMDTSFSSSLRQPGLGSPKAV